RVPPAVPLGVLPGRAIGEQPAQRADQPVHVLDGAAQVGRVGDRTGNGHRDGEMTGSESSPPGLTVPGPAARETLLPQGHVCRSFRSVMLAHAGGNGLIPKRDNPRRGPASRPAPGAEGPIDRGFNRLPDVPGTDVADYHDRPCGTGLGRYVPVGRRTSAMTDAGSIGERIRQQRAGRLPRLTQRELAEKSGVSVDLISKLEQGAKQSALLVTLHKIARALDVDVSVLVSQPVQPDIGAGAGENSGILAVRRAVKTVKDDAEPVTDDELRKSSTLAWGQYWSNRFDALAGLLPAFIATARATVREAASTAAYEALS